jgi:tetratricopeptide (TPR) repeat protein
MLLAPAVAVLLAAATPNPTAEAERLAADAVRLAPTKPQEALVQARKALSLTAEFEPTAFVKAGRKGEVVEDEYLAAREEYRRHRALVYQALGQVLLGQGQPAAAARYLRRAVLLGPDLAPTLALARSLLVQGKGRSALDVLERAYGGVAVSPELIEVVAAAADAAHLPSAQAEIDRARLLRLPTGAVAFRDGPLALPPGVKLSTAPVFRIEEVPTNLFYVAEVACNHCTSDLDELKRAVPKGVRVMTLPEIDDRDTALRQVLGLYRSDWPVVVGKGLAAALKLPARSVLIVGRDGWAQALLKAPFGASLPGALSVFAQNDIVETRPRAAWNRRPVERPAPVAPPGLLPEGLAPGEDDPAPPEFAAATEAFRSGRKAEALKAFDALEARGDGWLLPPEARLNRAQCLAGLGRREEARKLLLHTGDSRFQDEVDRALEAVGSPAVAPKR